MVGPFFLAFFVYHAAIAEARKCETEESTSYLRAEGLRLMEFAQETLHDVTLNTCARSCRESQKSYDCVSFEYDPNTQECSLHKSSGQPFGPSILAKTDLSRSFFEEVCLPTRLLCPTPYAFERYPQHALFGHSLEVLKVQGGLPECLSTCLDATSKLNIACRSVMFYYTTGECILNRETKTTAPALFSAVTDDDVVVDYFENNCFDVVCPSPSAALYWLRSEEFGIGHDKDIIIESMGIDDCKKLCSENEVAGEIFPCKAFVYSSAKEECHLSAESGLKKGREAFELSPISNGEYHEKICLTSTFRCKEASFEVTPKKQLVNVTSKVIETSNVNICLEACLNEQETCSSATYNYDLDECYLSEESQYTMATRFLPASNADYFDKICDYLPGRAFTSLSEQPFPLTSQTSFPTLNPTTLPLINATEQSITLSHLQSPDPEGFVPFTTDLFTASPPPPLDNSIDEGIHEIERDEKQIQSIHHSESADEDALSEESDGLFQANRPTVHAQMSTECRLSGISLILNFEQPTSGAIFIKEFFASCRVLFTDELTATLEIPFPRSDDPAPRCPGEEIRPGFWSFVVVVQRNEMKVPSLMTSSDRIFNVTCDYSSITEEELRLQPEMENSPSSTPSGRVQMSILLGGVPVSSVALGEEVELRWTLRPLSPEEAAQKERLGYFINECVAERIGGPPPEPEPLKLIFAG